MSAWNRWRRRATKLRAHPNPVRLVASRVLWHTGLSPLFTTKLSDGLSVRFYPSSVSAALWVEQDARNEDASFLRLVLRRGDNYVDCGANVGHLACVARAVIGEEGAVTAIEANPRIFGYCVGNLQLNGFSDVLAINVALGEKRGTTHISDERADDQNHLGPTGRVVPMRALDEVVGAGPITLLKLDVEGYELGVLRGAPRTLASASFVYCELSASNSARFGFAPADVEQLLLDGGFVFAERTAEASWRLIDRGVFAGLTPDAAPRTGYNLVAVKRSAIADFTGRLAAHGERVAPLSS